MTDPAAACSFLGAEVEALEPFGFVSVVPSGHPLHTTEVTRREDGSLEVRVPGRVRAMPEIDAAVSDALRDRGFASEDPGDRTEPWARDVADEHAAVVLLQELLVEVFGEKVDATLDVGHGSHRIEYEARQKLALARSRIENIATELLGRRPEQDRDGDYVLPTEEIQVTVAPRAAPDGQIVVRIFAITNVGVSMAPDLGLFLARLNFGLMFGRFALDVGHRSIWFDENLLGEEFRDEELRFAIRMVASTADAWDDPLKQMFGGATYQEILAERTAEVPAPIKPGEGVGLYL